MSPLGGSNSCVLKRTISCCPRDVFNVGLVYSPPSTWHFCFSQDLDNDAEGAGGRSSRWAGKKPLFDVQEYLTGVLWNLQMYIDGYVPNYYWRYSPRYSPSVSDILSFLQNNTDSLAKVSPPVTQTPPLPAAVACLCMMPMTETGKSFVPKRLQPLLTPGSPLLEALTWGGVSSGLDIHKILRVVYELAPGELRDFHNGFHNR